MSNTPSGEMTNHVYPPHQRRQRAQTDRLRPCPAPGTGARPAPSQLVPAATDEGHGFGIEVLPAAGLRPSGLEVVGPVAWGSHFCQFYHAKQDLLDILVPYFRAGLENNEFCMWVTSQPLDAEEAQTALAAVVPDLDRRISAGQIEILDYRQWYVRDGEFDADRVLRGWVDKLTAALHRGFEGLRLTGNTFWLEKSLWTDFSEYEATIDRVIGQYRMLALCTYSLEKCGVFEVMDVVRNHQFTLIRQGGQWEILQSLQRQAAEAALRASEQRYRALFSAMNEGFALHEIICDPQGRPYDYRFLEVNAAFERQTGLRAAELVGRTVREVLPGVEPTWIEQYGQVALTGQPARFEAWSEPLGRCYDVRAFQAAPGRFAVVFADITERKRAEEAIQSVALFPEQNPAPVLRVGRDGTLLYANTPSADLLAAWGCRPGQALPEEIRRHVERALDGGAAIEVEIPCDSVTYSFSIAPIRSEDYANLYARDITERQRAEEALHDAHGRLQLQAEELQTANEELNAQAQELRAANEELRRQERALQRAKEHWERTFDSVPDLIAILDDQHRVVQANRAMAERLGVKPGQCVGLPCHQMVHGMDAPPSFCPHAQTLQDGCEHLVEVHEERLGGVFLVSTTPLRDEHGRMIGSVHVARDITERQRAEEALRDAHGRLQLQAEELQTANEELNAQADELRTTNEELHRHKAVVQEAFEQRRLMLEAAELGTWDYRFDTGAVFWDERCRDMFGVPTGSRIGYDEAIAQIHPEDREAVDEAVRRVLAGTDDGVYHQEFRVVWPDGSLHWVASHGRVYFQGEGTGRRAARFIGVIQDITERKDAERALRESEERLRLALEGGRMGRWEWDLQTESDLWDERVCELLGLDPRVSPKSETFFARVDARDRDALRALVEKTLLADQEDFQAEFRVVHHGGESLWLASRGKVVRDAHGQAVRVIGVMYDVTPRKQMEEQLRRLNDQLEEEVQAQTEELRDTIDRLQDEVVRRVLAEGKLRRHSQMLEAFFQHTITPLAFMDKHFNFVRVNEAYARADGKTPESFIGKNHFVLYPHAENRAIFEQVVRTGQPYFAHARPFCYPDDPGRVTYWDWQLTPLSNEFGDVQFLVLNLEDVTERQQAFQEIEQRARQLQKLTLELSQAEDRERKRLAEILHDDLQQQLAAAKFHLGILGGRVKGDGALREITGRVNDLLKEAIEKSRSLSHELSPAVLYQSDLGETFEWLAQQVQKKHGLTVHLEVRGRVDCPSEAMKTFLYKAAQEILFNVVKHSRVKEATVRLQRIRGQLWLTVSDQGRGFDPKGLGRTGGFGLLSIRERIELLGGRMKIKSAAGKGSTFLIAVPDERVPEGTPDHWTLDVLGVKPSRSALRAPRRPSSDHTLRVLLADDHAVMREGLATLLNEQEDIEIVGQAANGREAVDLAYRLQPDVVVMDAAMPVMPGDEATRQIKRHLPETRVVALSMFDEVAMAERMRRAGAETYLLKTAPSEELLAVIRARK